MKCSIVFVCVLVCLAKFCEGWVLRCPPGVQDSSCTEENIEVETQESSVITEVQCLAGTEWESNCHYCRCSDTGVAECVKQDICNMELFVEPSLCKPNTTFLRDCNTCVCLDNGLGLCTLRNCRRSHVIKNTPEISDVSTSEKVSTKQAETPAATLPIPKDSEEENFPLNQIMLKFTTLCKPREVFMKDCNPCKCSDNGLSFTCTRNECLDGDKNIEVEVFKENEGVDHIERHSVCRARQTFNIGCNTCHCNKFGTDYACTSKACLPPDVEVFDRVDDLKAVTPYTIDDGLKVIKP